MPKTGVVRSVRDVATRLVRLLMSLPGVLQGLPGMLMPGQVVFFFVSLGGNGMRVNGGVVHFGGALMIAGLRAEVWSFGHLKSPYLAGLVVRFSCQFKGLLRVVPSSCRVPGVRGIVFSFVVFRGGSMSPRSKLMLFRGISVQQVHVCPSRAYSAREGPSHADVNSEHLARIQRTGCPGSERGTAAT